ncbi:YvcK family protein [Candidatus Woesearchaeota archaeon]|nr:YvcK family protein [Candidatus Woesearchaeota archaeon]
MAAQRAKKFVVFGGGNAVPKAVLPGLKNLGAEITAITSMADSGGSSGQLRKDFSVLPPGDIRRHLLALSDAPEWKKQLFAFRFGHEEFEGGHKGHSFGNVFLAGLEHVLGDYGKALDFAHQFLEVKGKCLPATTDKVQVVAVLENSEAIVGEDEIDVPKKHSPHVKIRKISLKPGARAYPPVLEAIRKADFIAIGPGDLYSSLLPSILPRGIAEALRESKAKKAFICPAMTKLGETQEFAVADFAAEAEKYMKSPLDFVIYNTTIPDSSRIALHKKEEPAQTGPVKINKGLDGKRFIGKDLLKSSGMVVYDTGKVAAAITKLACSASPTSRQCSTGHRRRKATCVWN